MRLLFLSLATTAAAQIMPAPDVAAIPRLPCVTTGFGNTLIRGNSFQDKSQTWMQLYTADMAVSAEGFVFLTTKWEEGLRAAGIYKDGEALPDLTGLGVNSGEAVAVSEHFAAYARLLNRKEGPVHTLVLYERSAGKALDGAKQRTAYLTEQKGSITGLAINEARDRVYFADDEGVKALSLTTMKPLDFRIAQERAGKMFVDDGGALWVIQRGTSPYAHTKLQALVFGSEPIDAEHGLEQAVSSSDKMRYIAKDRSSAFVGFDFGKAVAVSRFSLMGDIAKADCRQLKVQTSTTGRDGPWTDVATPQDKLYGYPEEFVTLDASQPIRAVRVIAPDLTMCRMAAYAPPQPLPGRVLKYDPQGQKQPQSVESIMQPMDIAIDPRMKQLFVADGGLKRAKSARRASKTSVASVLMCRAAFTSAMSAWPECARAACMPSRRTLSRSGACTAPPSSTAWTPIRNRRAMSSPASITTATRSGSPARSTVPASPMIHARMAMRSFMACAAGLGKSSSSPPRSMAVRCACSASRTTTRLRSRVRSSHRATPRRSGRRISRSASAPSSGPMQTATASSPLRNTPKPCAMTATPRFKTSTKTATTGSSLASKACATCANSPSPVSTNTACPFGNGTHRKTPSTSCPHPGRTAKHVSAASRSTPSAARPSSSAFPLTNRTNAA